MAADEIVYGKKSGRVAFGQVCWGWTPWSWCRELRRMAECCKKKRPDKSKEYADWAESIEQKVQRLGY